MKKPNSIKNILSDLITEDDKNRNKVSYDLNKTLDKVEKRILNLRLRDLINMEKNI